MEHAIEIYRSTDGQVELNIQLKDETVWLTQKQISLIFGTQTPAINKHIKNICNCSANFSLVAP